MSNPRLIHFVNAALALAIFAAVLYTMHRLLAEVHFSAVAAAARATPLQAIGLAVLFTLASYVMLAGYDRLAMHTLGKRVPYPFIILASFASYAIANAVGLTTLTGGSVRYRIYAPLGLGTGEIVRLTAICAQTFGLAIALLLGLSMALNATRIGYIDQLPDAANQALGVLLLGALGLYLAWVGAGSRQLRLGGWLFDLPDGRTTLAQIIVGTLDMLFAAAAAYVLLPADAAIGYLPFTGLFVAAVSLSWLSHIPGGLGVLEGTMLLAMPEVAADHLLASLLVFRIAYYLLPFALASTLLLGLEARQHSATAGLIARRLGPLIRIIAPNVAGMLVLGAGTVLLVSGATPEITARLDVVSRLLPLPLIELSHLIGSVIGVLLLILARGLFRRLDGAWVVAQGLLAGGIVASLAKGFDYEEALFLTFVSLLLYVGRDAFYRRSSLLDVSFRAGWIVTIVGAVGLSLAVGLFAYKHVEYAHELWWQFALDSDASRFLRASLAAMVVLAGFFSLRLMQVARPRTGEDAGVTEAVEEIIARSPRAEAALAWTGDKQILVSKDGSAFLMYAVSGASWVVLGDPVGDPAAFRGLLWQFRELVDRQGGWPVFFEVGTEHLPLYIDLGLTLAKLGEAATVDLHSFSLEGSSRRDLRYSVRRAEREGLSFEVIPAARVRERLPELQAISDAWLQQKHAAEKGFSLGFFAPDYIARCDCAVISRGGTAIAFANLLKGAVGGELSVDLMRHLDVVPFGTMDFLFAHLMMWGRAQGYTTFDLGMAPLSGLASHALAPTWALVGTLIFRYGEHFYNFEGLRAYKQKFRPQWTPRYLATPGGLILPRVLLDVTGLIGGGITGIIARRPRSFER
jgi:phosphatidylglycerol lysyltransferase